MPVSRALLVILGVLSGFMPSPTTAETWKRAESSHFILYSNDDSDDALRRHAQTLEAFDGFLRRQFDVDTASAPASKLPIFLVERRSDLRRVDPHIDPVYAGAYYPTLEGVFAVAVRTPDQEYLRHEYFHHFAFQELGARRFPTWLSEGLAEYFMTARIDGDSIEMGRPSPSRAKVLARGRWLPLHSLLACRPADLTEVAERNSYYAVAWLLTHWLMSDVSRRGRLEAYIDDFRSVSDPAGALERATGLSLEQIGIQLRQHARVLRPSQLETELPSSDIQVSTLPSSAGDVLLLSQRLKLDLSRDERAEALKAARRASELHPKDPFVKLQRARAEIRFGDGELGEALLVDVLTTQPDDVQALQMMAYRRQQLARIRADQATEQLAAAHAFLTRALEIAPNDPYTSYLLALNGSPPGGAENALDRWRTASEQAPQVDTIRISFGEALLRSGRDAEAVAVVEPLIDSPHGGAGAELARDLILRVQGSP